MKEQKKEIIFYLREVRGNFSQKVTFKMDLTRVKWYI